MQIFSGLKTEDKIFPNLYGFEASDLNANLSRGVYSGIDEIIKKTLQCVGVVELAFLLV